MPACPRCGKPVYFAEQVLAFGRAWHKGCFKCVKCGKALDSSTSVEHKGQAYCKECYGKTFGPKGFGYGHGAGALTHPQ